MALGGARRIDYVRRVSIFATRLEQLREHLQALELAAFVVPKADEFQFEYVHPAHDRLAWLTGFDGSAGLAVVGRSRACLFVDGRYTEQVRAQTSSPPWEYADLTSEAQANWLRGWIAAGDRVGYDARLHTPASLAWLRDLAERTGATLCPETTPIDAIWTDRPALGGGAIEAYPDAIAGATAAAKRTRMAERLRSDGLDALAITDPTNLMWLLNVRGHDLEHTPLALGFGLLYADGSVRVFMDPDKWTAALQHELRAGGPGETRFEPLHAWAEALGELGSRRVRVDRLTATAAVIERLEACGATVDVGADPCALAKACKTPEELAGIRAAHVRDGASVVRFLHWLDVHAPGGHTEWTLVEKLAEFRAGNEHHRGPSFRTISAFGPSGASPHYTVRPESALPLAEGNLYLVDSGGQYLDGTTDITRVVCIGTPTPEMRRRYTQVLRGHVALSRARFPQGTQGGQLDPFARQFLWADGVDYAHGTGHGVGCYLSVHEGPQRISTRGSEVPLQPGMVLSNEPGYYKPGAFGIRIENLVVVTPVEPPPTGAERPTLGFDTLTLCPYEPRLIEREQLLPEECAWIDAYHAHVRSTLTPRLPDDAAAWLARVTAPLSA